MNKKGYIRVLEAGIAIIILLGFIFFFSMPTYVHRTDLDKEIYKSIDSVFDEMGRKSVLREAIFGSDITTLNDFIEEKLKTKALAGVVVVCDIDQPCVPLEGSVKSGKDIYVRERIIARSSTEIKKVAIHAWTTY